MNGLRDELPTVPTSHSKIALIDIPGDATPLVFIHGNSVCKEVFAAQLDAFAGSRRVIAIDLPGHGASSDAADPHRTYSLTGYADCIVEVLQAMGIARAIVVGWSLGGHIGLELINRFPGLAGLLAVGTPPFEVREDGALVGFRPHPRIGLSAQERFSDEEAIEYAALIGDFDDAPPTFWSEATARSDGRARTRMFESLFEGNPRRQRELAEHAPVPLALVNGADDAFVDIGYIEGLSCHNLWSGRQFVIPGQRHAPHVHAAEEFNRTLNAFANQIPPG